MKIWMTLAIAAGLIGPAFAQEDTLTKADREPPHELTQQEKVDALKMAYRLNGNSMVGHNKMIDLTDPRVLEEYARLVDPEPPEMPLIYPPPVPVEPKRKLASVEPKADICRRHGKRKVMTNGGRSWRCR